jgi:hypothetical protein
VRTSVAPPPYTMALSRTRLRATHNASCSDRFISSRTYKIALIGLGPKGDFLCEWLTHAHVPRNQIKLAPPTILLPPRTKMVTAFMLGQPSTTNILSFVVPNPTCSSVKRSTPR